MYICIYAIAMLCIYVYSYFEKSFSGGEYHMYLFIPLHSCDYFKKNLIKTNLATDEGNGRNET